MKTGAQLLLGAAALAAAIWGLSSYRTSLIEQGAARVQALWDAEKYQRTLATGQANAVRQRAAEKVAEDHAQRQATTEKRFALAAATERSLRAEIKRLNSRPKPFTVDDTGLAACTREATAARELLGACGHRYTVRAGEADGLRDQVLGLQQWAADVCHARVPAAGGTE